jgi:hypothetical protein
MLRLKKHWVIKRADSNAGASVLEDDVRADPTRETRIEAGKLLRPTVPWIRGKDQSHEPTVALKVQRRRKRCHRHGFWRSNGSFGGL